MKKSMINRLEYLQQVSKLVANNLEVVAKMYASPQFNYSPIMTEGIALLTAINQELNKNFKEEKEGGL